MRRFLNPLVPVLLAALFVLAAMVGGPSNDGDAAIVRSLMRVRAASPSLTGSMVAITWLGSAYATLGLATLCAILLAARKAHGRALLLILTVVLERLSVDQLKLVIARARPDFDVHPVMTSSYSFPSGHAANSLAAFLAIAIIAVPPNHRRMAVAIAAAMGTLVGVSRIYLGVHWPSDVIGGWSLALIATWIAVVAGQRSAALEPEHQIVGGHRPALGEDETA